MIQGIFDQGAMPALEKLVEFTSRRHQVLADNIANLSTPNYKANDLDPAAFQRSLRQAIDRRRQNPDPQAGRLDMDSEFHTTPTGDAILFHDEGSRDLERTMQHLAENTITHNVAIELLRSEMSVLRTAIRERIG